MRETSDNMQELAQTYGERTCMEYCIQTLGKMKNQENQRLMTKIFRLFAIECLRRDLAWYLIQGVISKQALSALTPTRHQLISDIALKASDILDCLSIAKDALYVPIAADYMKYNASPNHGEIIGAAKL